MVAAASAVAADADADVVAAVAAAHAVAAVAVADFRGRLSTTESHRRAFLVVLLVARATISFAGRDAAGEAVPRRCRRGYVKP